MFRRFDYDDDDDDDDDDDNDDDDDDDDDNYNDSSRSKNNNTNNHGRPQDFFQGGANPEANQWLKANLPGVYFGTPTVV